MIISFNVSHRYDSYDVTYWLSNTLGHIVLIVLYCIVLVLIRMMSAIDVRCQAILEFQEELITDRLYNIFLENYCNVVVYGFFLHLALVSIPHTNYRIISHTEISQLGVVVSVAKSCQKFPFTVFCHFCCT